MHLRFAIIGILAGCTQEPPARPSPSPVVELRQAIDAGRSDATVLEVMPVTVAAEQLALHVVADTCDKPALDDCRLASLRETRPAGNRLVQGCAVATRVELRHRDLLSAELCSVVVQHGTKLLVVEADLQCKRHDDGNPRVTLAGVDCSGAGSGASTGPDLVVELEVARSRLRLTCSGNTCTRDASPAPSDPALTTFLGAVRKAASAHQWEALLELCAREHRQMQLGELKQPRAAYLREILGMSSPTNRLGGDKFGLADLAQIARLELTEIAPRVRAGDFLAIG